MSLDIWKEFNVSCLSKIKKKNLSLSDMEADDVTGYPGADSIREGHVPIDHTWGR